jgi:hypothetical protein
MSHSAGGSTAGDGTLPRYTGHMLTYPGRDLGTERAPH